MFKVAVNESTVKQENGWVFLVIRTNYNFVEPYIVDHLSVVSRKKNKKIKK